MLNKFLLHILKRNSKNILCTSIFILLQYDLLYAFNIANIFAKFNYE